MSHNSLLISRPKDLGGQPRDGGGCLVALVLGVGDTVGEGPCYRDIKPSRGYNYLLWLAVALEHAVTLYGCSGGPISIRTLPNSQVASPFWSVANPGVRVLWCGGYAGSSTTRVPAMGISLAVAALVALHRGSLGE